jgi:hypothetical protein
MKFDKLHAAIPYVKGGKEKILTMKPYPDITLKMPGRHAKDTDPIGGDFVVCVSDNNMEWQEHQFTHSDLFADLHLKSEDLPNSARDFMGFYLEVVQGADPEVIDEETAWSLDMLAMRDGIDPVTLIRALQCLAIAEHRRYHQHEAKFGGRYLPFRFAAGIVDGLWSPLDAASKEKYGRPGVEQLERQNGTPLLTKKLMGTDG